MTDYYSGCSCCSHLVLIAKEIKTMDSGVIVVKEYYVCEDCGEEHWERFIH